MIYVVEDDTSIRELIVYTLNSMNLKTVGFEKPSDFWDQLDSEIPTLVMLDIMLPEENGIDILKKLRKRVDTKALPIIMVTAKTSEYDRIAGLDNGADDYIPKPISLPLMIKKIEAVFRRYNKKEETENNQMWYREICLIIGNYRVIINGESIDLTQKEYEILKELMEHPGAVISRESFLNRLWKYEFYGDERAVDNHIKNLRKKLGSLGNYIETVRGVGYRLEKVH